MPIVPAGTAAARAVASPAPLALHVAGVGAVGRAFLEAVAPRAAAGELRVVAVSDRTGTLFDPAGLDPGAVATAKASGAGLASVPAPFFPWEGASAAARLPADVVVDLTAGPWPDGVDSPLLAALGAGRDVVTAEKTVLAGRPAEVARRRAGRRVLASATVGGAVPVLETLSGPLRAAGILEVIGAWSATANYVLSRMEEGVPLDRAIADARRAGYAEADAERDLDGRDAAAKAAIVAASAFGASIAAGDVTRRGLGAADLARAARVRAAGHRVRLVARVRPEEAVVEPATLPSDHPLAVVGAESAVLVRTALAGDHVLRGPGAGGAPTAAAVLSDCLSLAAERSHR